MKLEKRLIIYILVSIFLLLLVGISVDFNQSTLGIILYLLVGILLTQSYILPGMIGPKLQDKFWKEKSWEDKNSEYNPQLLPNWIILLVPLLMSGIIILTVKTLSENFEFIDGVTIFLYIFVPSTLLYFRKWFTLFLSTLWVWFPIEWGVIDNHLGNFTFEILPADALLGLTAVTKIL